MPTEATDCAHKCGLHQGPKKRRYGGLPIATGRPPLFGDTKRERGIAPMCIVVYPFNIAARPAYAGTHTLLEEHYHRPRITLDYQADIITHQWNSRSYVRAPEQGSNQEHPENINRAESHLRQRWPKAPRNLLSKTSMMN